MAALRKEAGCTLTPDVNLSLRSIALRRPDRRACQVANESGHWALRAAGVVSGEAG